MSDILKSVHDTVKGLHKAGVVDKTTLRKFDALCLTQVHEFTPEQIKALRKRYGVSQGVLAYYLNVSDKSIKKWEQGESTPKGAALKLLVLAESKGLDCIR
jgi:putative transcriptional regulator